jgi:hypothetical protein
MREVYYALEELWALADDLPLSRERRSPLFPAASMPARHSDANRKQRDETIHVSLPP